MSTDRIQVMFTAFDEQGVVVHSEVRHINMIANLGFVIGAWRRVVEQATGRTAVRIVADLAL